MIYLKHFTQIFDGSSLQTCYELTNHLCLKSKPSLAIVNWSEELPVYCKDLIYFKELSSTNQKNQISTQLYNHNSLCVVPKDSIQIKLL